ncbi:MAG: hypothetical protein LUD83_00835 [Clostridiales bacterium]|nr:hypothetical protein [Clostridiales bacterium]
MSGDMRPELSPNSEFWIERHRYYELKHFCLQYRAWKRMVALLDGYGEASMPNAVKSGEIGYPPMKFAERRE